MKDSFVSNFRWLHHVEQQLLLDESERSTDISWSAFNASRLENQRETRDISTLLPLFRDSSKSAAMIRHGMEVTKLAVDHVNKGQTPVIAFDQPLYALAKQVQWNWKDLYGEGRFVVMMGALHIEMAALKTLGDWLEESGWCSALVEAEIASAGTAQSFIYASHVSRTRSAHQVSFSTVFIEKFNTL